VTQSEIPGYTYGSPSLPASPISMGDLERLQRALLWSEDDARALRRSREILADQVEDVLDVWYGFVASQPFLVYYFTRTSDDQPDQGYLDAVRKRFGRWILDTASGTFDQQWLDYQAEIARRHHREKNRTDGVDSVPLIHLRYVLALTYPITYTLRPFLAKKGAPVDEVEAMYQAWLKAVLLQVILWSQPYVRDGEF
jgi:hypothetical protein